MIQMVPETGIEPVTLSLEGFCSSTELPGRKNQSLESLSKKEKKSNRTITKNSRVLFENSMFFAYNTLYNESKCNLNSFFQDLGIYLLSHVKPRSTIDATELNFCVRKGNRCTLCAIYTKILKKRKLF